MPAPVLITEHDPAWSDIFHVLCRRVARVVGDVAVAIDHVGSTAVPGLAAKPIIDMDVVLRSTADFPAAIERLTAAGYTAKGDLGITGREAFSPPADASPHHLYVVTVDNPAYCDHILLRDYLRRHPDEAHAYGELKKAAADRFRDNRTAYTNMKGALVQEMTRRAEEEEEMNLHR
jgi:GrpB-like predicted nucleotidyltransferase (UPF0157 family)